MKNKKIKLIISTSLLLIGIILVGIGIYGSVMDNMSAKFNGLFYGLGAGIIGASISQIATIKLYNKNPKFLRKKTIEVQDERNIHLKEKAKSKVYDLFNILFPMMILVLYIANVNLVMIGVMLGLYVLRFILYIIFFNKYDKEM